MLPRDDRLEIMLGDQGAGAVHLTHSVAHPDGLAVASSDPRHAVLRITHGAGQTLIVLVIRVSAARLADGARTGPRRHGRTVTGAVPPGA